MNAAGTLHIGVILLSGACLLAGCQRRDEPTQGGAQSTTTPGTMGSTAQGGTDSSSASGMPGAAASAARADIAASAGNSTGSGG